MRIAFHAINGVGLGHVVRVVALAEEIRMLVPQAELLVCTNAGDVSLLKRKKIDFVQFPPRLDEPHADPERVLTALPAPVEEAVLGAALTVFAPDLVVFDTHAPMRIVRRVAELGARAVLVLRELRPEALRAFVKSGAPLAFDRIVVPHEPDEVDIEALPGAALVGPIVRKVRAPRGIPSGPPRVVAMAGGGGQPVDARRYLRAVADAHLLARARIPRLTTVMVTGPYGEAPPHVERYPGLTVVRSLPDLTPLLAKATLVVSQAGYNAVAEIRTLEKPVILVPGRRKAEDQRARALRLARTGAAVIAKPEARAIADQMEALLLRRGALEAMRGAHRTHPLVPKNRRAAEAVLRPLRRMSRAIEKVVLVAHDFAPKVGGMESVARALVKSLRARGIDVRVYTTNRLGVRDGDAIYQQRIDLSADLLTTIDRALRDAPDVIHLCHAGLGPWIPSLRASLPCVVTANVHGNDLIAPWVAHSEADGVYRASQIAGLSAADAVFCVSRFSTELARTRGVNEAVLRTVENGVDAQRFHPGPPDPALRHRLGLHEDDEIVLTVSRLAPRKGHRTALEAVARLAARRPRLKYVFTGESHHRRTELAALSDELGIASRVVAAGFVSDEELPALYRLARVFVLLSESDPASDVEGFGVALLEAAASGLPVVAAHSGGMPEAVAPDETAFLVAPGDVEGAAEAMGRLLDRPELARAFGERGRARIVERFSEERTAERMLEVWAAEPPRDVARGVDLVRAAQQHGAERLREREARRATLRAALLRKQLVRLRAIGDGARLLPDALEDCAALGHAPRVEVKLRRFLDADFRAHALPRIEQVELVHGVPHPSAHTLLATLRSLPAETLTRVRTVRLFLSEGARPATAVSETHALRQLFRQGGTVVVPPPELMRYLSLVPAGGPETGMIEPTNLCNLACPTCPTGTGKIKPRPSMTLDAFERVLSPLTPRMRNLALWNYGEPLLNRDLPAMIARAKAAGVAVVKVSSNVHFLDGERGRSLLGSGLDVLILSVDGASPSTYATFRKEGDFERVAHSVAWLCAEKKRLGLTKPRIELQFIVMRHNEHELPEIRRLARVWGVDALRIKTVGAEDEETKGLVPASRLLSRYKEDGVTPNTRHSFCTMAWDHTVVNVDGSVTPCCYLRPDMGDAFVMGNVFENDFASIWRGQKYRDFRAAMLDGRESMPVCDRCRGGTHDLIAAVEEIEAP
jgi:radical SAM protein with 4Fe4S-binding SPASM domain